jgi:hypothetical protein
VSKIEVRTLTSASLHERGLGHLYPIALDELETLANRRDWGSPREVPGAALLKATEAAVKRTKARLALDE